VHQVGHYPELHQDARLTKHKKVKKQDLHAHKMSANTTVLCNLIINVLA
jgi:hypothetical protein